MWCSTSITAIELRSESISFASSDISSAPSPPAGSSSSSSWGSDTSARASATRFCDRERQRRRQPNGDVVAVQPFQRRMGPLAQLALVAIRPRQRQQRAGEPGAAEALGADHHVLEHGQSLEQPDALQRARDAQLGELGGAVASELAAAPLERAGLGAHEAADHVEQRRLAGAVGPDHAEHLAR